MNFPEVFPQNMIDFDTTDVTCKVGGGTPTFSCLGDGEQYTHTCPIDNCTINQNFLDSLSNVKNIIPEFNERTINADDQIPIYDYDSIVYKCKNNFYYQNNNDPLVGLVSVNNTDPR